MKLVSWYSSIQINLPLLFTSSSHMPTTSLLHDTFTHSVSPRQLSLCLRCMYFSFEVSKTKALPLANYLYYEESLCGGLVSSRLMPGDMCNVECVIARHNITYVGDSYTLCNIESISDKTCTFAVLLLFLAVGYIICFCGFIWYIYLYSLGLLTSALGQLFTHWRVDMWKSADSK